MASLSPLFNEDWLRHTRQNAANSWANEVIDTINTTGQIYLSTLRLWFETFPLNDTQKQHLYTRLASHQNSDHLGAVNELAWWRFMLCMGIVGSPLPTATTPRPDFKLESPADCFVEVSTLNVSERDEAAFKEGKSVALNHFETIRRILGKLTDEKQQQLLYAASQEKAAVLALFDYTEWSAFGTQLYLVLGEHLLGTQFGYKHLPQDLSAIVLLERHVIDGRIALSCNRSAVYYNPLATYLLPPDTFFPLRQFQCQLAIAEPRPIEHSISL